MIADIHREYERLEARGERWQGKRFMQFTVLKISERW